MPTIQKQIHLPTSRAIEIALKSLKNRWLRSVLTLATIALAIAFLAFIWLTRFAEPQLSAAAGKISPSVAAGAGGGGGTARTIWLLSLSLLVCLVGITNAMLMSVMERFREIGTMKCLGALDSFILKLFFLESLFLGATGAALGSLLGSLLALLQLLHEFGPNAWSHLPWRESLAIAAASAAIGITITAAAALYPALKAAQMNPIAAMRVEV